MELKEYQIKSLDQVKLYLGQLDVWRGKAEVNPELEIDFPAKAWEKAGVLRPYISRKNGLGEPLPNFCLKIPTGGGKTLLAVKTIDVVNHLYLKKQAGLVLWIVPTTQIYRQTINNLKDRDHPYRQFLDIASGGKTLILEKNDHFSKSDIAENLTVLMLMLPSANRQNKEALKVFKDNGFADFFPAEDNIVEQEKLLKEISNLDTYDDEIGFWGRQIKTSLGNTLRVLKPVIILDEGHKAYSEGAQATLRSFNPTIIVELSATPPKESNILVDIPGIDLKNEEMVKLDLHIINKSSLDWQDTLVASYDKLLMLQKRAQEYKANSGNYIRPICVIQAERTGKDQRGNGFIHSEDVREFLIKKCAVPAEEIAVKTSEKDELKEVDDLGGLMSKDCKIKYIITKQALQEGWDCPFAYVLTILTRPSSKNALTQLVGRILRQPNARKIKTFPELDESYVFCYQQEASSLLENIKKGFENEGLGDLAGRIVTDEDISGEKTEERIFGIRKKFENVAKEIVLPVFVIRDGGWRRVEYENDIATKVDWQKINLDWFGNLSLAEQEEKDTEQIATIVENRKQLIERVQVKKLKEGSIKLDNTFMARQIIEVASNPWLAYEMAEKILSFLIKKHGERRVVNNFIFIIEETKKYLAKQRDNLAEDVFKKMIKDKTLRFLVIGKDFGYRLPREIKVKNTARPLLKSYGAPLQLSLLEFVPEEDFNNTEKSVALYLEEQERLYFWYRNQVKSDYSIQGWRRQRIYPDFIFATGDGKINDSDRIYVAETKGQHLVGNQDSEYKESLLNLCTELAREKNNDELGLVFKNREVSFEFIGEDEWKQRLNELLAPSKKILAKN